MSAVDLSQLANLPLRTFADGEVILTEDRPNTALYFLKSGAVEVLRNGTHIDTDSTPGAVLGEISTLLKLPPIATVKASGTAEVHVAEDPDQFLAEHPEVILDIAKTLAARLHRASSFLSDLRKQTAADSEHMQMIHGVLESLLKEESAK